MNELRSSVWHGRVTLDGVNVSDRCLGVLVEGDRAVAVRLLRRDERGQKWFKFVCSYSDGNDQFNFEIWALNSEDAQRRMVLIAQTGKVDGQLFQQFHA